MTAADDWQRSLRLEMARKVFRLDGCNHRDFQCLGQSKSAKMSACDTSNSGTIAVIR